LKNKVKYHEVLTLEKLQVNLGLVNSDIKITMKTKEEKLRISMKLRGIINEYHGEKDLTNEKEQKELRSEIRDELHDQMVKLLETFQSNKVDPLYLGLYSKNLFSQAYYEDEWKEEWSKFDVDVDVRLTINDYGVYQSKGYLDN
jgi:spore germination protein